MKISFVIQDLFQQGAEYVTAMMVKGFAEKGYEVDVLVSQVHVELLAKGDKPFPIPDSVNTITMPSRKARENVRFLRKYLKTTEAQTIVAMCPTYLPALALASLFNSHKKKLAYVEHGGLSGTQLSIDDVNPPTIFSPSWILSKICSQKIDCFMAVSKGSARVCEKTLLLPSNTVIPVYNPVIDNSFFEKMEQCATEPWLIDKQVKTICAAGAFCELKDHYTLFKAIKVANETMPVRLVLFGKGYLEDDYKEWIKKNDMEAVIKLPGHTHNLPAELKSADAFVCSSLVESFSIVIVEALAAGVPVISTACSYGPPEILNQGAYGRLVPVGDVASMAKAIVESVSTSNNIPEESWKRFALPNIVSNYENALGLV